MAVYYAQAGAYVTDDKDIFKSAIDEFALRGLSDAIIDAYMIPKAIINYPTGSAQYQGQSQPKRIIKYISKPTTIDSYIPKNQKLLTFPYCYMNLDNNNGSTNSLFYELFKTNADVGHESDCKFTIKGVPVIGGSIKCSPNNYKNTSTNDVETEGIMAGKYPTLSWSEDSYINWLTQNAVNLGVGITSDVVAFASNIGIGNVGGVVSSSLSFANKMGQFYQHSLVPNTARGNTNGGDISTCDNTNTFYFYKMSIRQNYAREIDDYFTRYGYKINKLKRPNITGRKYWNYVEIGGSEEIGFGEIPSKSMQDINNACRKGVTIWHNHANLGDFSLDNIIL